MLIIEHLSYQLHCGFAPLLDKHLHSHRVGFPFPGRMCVNVITSYYTQQTCKILEIQWAELGDSQEHASGRCSAQHCACVPCDLTTSQTSLLLPSCYYHPATTSLLLLACLPLPCGQRRPSNVCCQFTGYPMLTDCMRCTCNQRALKLAINDMFI